MTNNEILIEIPLQDFVSSYSIQDKDGDYWLDYNKFQKDYQSEVNILIGNNSTGKSYSLEELYFDWITHDKKCIWMRLMYSESQRCVNLWYCVFKRHGIDILVGKEGVKKEWTVNTSGIWHYNELVCGFAWLKNIAVSQPTLEGIKGLAVDEILTDTSVEGIKPPTFKNPIALLTKVADRARMSFNDELSPIWLIGNPHSYETDFFSDVNFYPDYEKLYNGGSIFQQYKTPNGLTVSVCWLGDDWDSWLRAHNKKFDRQCAKSERLGVDKYPKPHPLTCKIVARPDDLVPLYSISYSECQATIYQWENHLYIDKFDMNLECPRYCIEKDDYFHGLFKSLAKDDLAMTFNSIYTHWSNAEIYASSPYYYQHIMDFVYEMSEIVEEDWNDD